MARYTLLAVTISSWDQRLAPFHLDAARRWRTLAILGWTVVCVVLIVMFIAKPEKVTGFAPYLKGATRWFEGLDIYSYKPNKGFVYSPLAAVFFAPFTYVHPAVANVLWRLLSTACLLAGLWSMLRFGPFEEIPNRLHGLVYLLLLPLSLSNLDSGQANPIVIGLIMAGLAAACQERWTLAALAIAAAVHWKVYPLVVGLLLMVIAPWRFSWRFLLFLAVMAAVPFLFQKPDYVLEQYREWIATRTADNRLQYALEIAPLDLWFLVVRAMGLPLSELAYHGLRAFTGAALAGYCLVGRLRGWPAERLYGGLFAFVCVWMVLLGPASEWLTYLLLAPAAALAVTQVLSPASNLFTRVTALAAYGILLLAVFRVGFFPKIETPWLLSWALALQPIGALFYFAYAARRYLPDSRGQLVCPPKWGMDGTGVLQFAGNSTASACRHLFAMLYNKLTGPAAGFLDLRMIAHDMRAPLHALNLSVHAARRQNRNPEAVATLLELAERNVRVLSALVESMLSADTGAGKEHLILRECESHEIVARALDQVAALAAEKGQRLESPEMLALPPLVADANSLVRVLVNLLVNAVKFSPAGCHIEISVKLRINDGHRVQVFSVADDGVGVAPDQIDRIFKEGISLAVTGQPSNGLGLAVCRAIVEAHHGRIWVETGRTRGAKFSFAIPAELPATRRPGSPARSARQTPRVFPEAAGE